MSSGFVRIMIHLQPPTWTFQAQSIKRGKVKHPCVVYSFKCDLCDADYIGCTADHLHKRMEEHKSSAIGRHMKEDHGVKTPDLTNISCLFVVC